MKIFCIIILICVLFIIPYKVMITLKKEKKVEIVIACTFWLGVPFISWGCYLIKINNKRKKEISHLVKNLNNQSVDTFINYINEWGCFNHPNAWGELKGAWRIANESPNISYNKKKELRDCLMLNGLKLYNNEMNIIDNKHSL